MTDTNRQGAWYKTTSSYRNVVVHYYNTPVKISICDTSIIAKKDVNRFSGQWRFSTIAAISYILDKTYLAY